MANRDVRGDCLICGERVEDGEAVYVSSCVVDRRHEFGCRDFHEERGTARVRLNNRTPKGIVHRVCMSVAMRKPG